MANSKYEYVRSFEQPDILLPNTWIVVRIDGRGFSKFTTKHNFTKPNDRRALDLMNAAAVAVMKELHDLCLAYGNSDEYSFVFHKHCALFERRASKLTTTIVSTFSSYYTFLWPNYFPDSPLTPPLPSFDGRAVCYPSDQNLRDYMSWRQVDCHINNLYNTTFWALVLKGGMEARAAEQELSGTVSSDKNEILFSRFGINYNNEPEIFKKGSVLYRDFFPASTESTSMPSSIVDSPLLVQPQAQGTGSRPMSDSAAPTERNSVSSTPSSDSTTRGPTFLSTSTTPSPPPSPSSMSIPTFPLPRDFLPSPLPANGPPTTASKLPKLAPIPLPPPTLTPTTKPPQSLNPPNPTAHTNTSPQASPPPPSKSPHRTSSNPAKAPSHSASASASLSISTASRPSTSTASSSRPSHKHRSPSLSNLDSQQPPIIPLRISSIPANSKPRKLSLQSQRSLNVSKEKETEGGGNANERKSESELRIMKEFPSPAVDNRNDMKDQGTPLTTIAASTATAAIATRSPKSAKSPTKPSKDKSKVTEEGGWAAGTQDESSGRPKEMSRTQRDKERKKKSKAKIVVEHVDVIRDEFWMKRPWILSGKTGL